MTFFQNRTLQVGQERAESPKAPSSGQHPGYTRSQQCALQGQEMADETERKYDISPKRDIKKDPRYRAMRTILERSNINY